MQDEDIQIQCSEASGIDLFGVCRWMLDIVAVLSESGYTKNHIHQTVERQPDDLADPASDIDTSQG